jgi:hypothetical protein
MSAQEADAVQASLLTYLSGGIGAEDLAEDLGSIPADYLRQLLIDLSDSGSGPVELRVLRPHSFRRVFEALRHAAEAHPALPNSSHVLRVADAVLVTLSASPEVSE